VRKELVGDEQNDTLLEQAVVECTEELSCKQRSEPPRTKQMSDVLHQGEGTLTERAARIASFASATQPYNDGVHADAAKPADVVPHPGGADPGIPAVEAGALRLSDCLRALLHRRNNRLFRRIS